MVLPLFEPGVHSLALLAHHAKAAGPPPAGFVIYAGGLVTGAVYVAWWRVRQLYRHREHDHRLDVIRREFHGGHISLAEAERKRKKLGDD